MTDPDERLQMLREQALAADTEPVSDPVELAKQSIQAHWKDIGMNGNTPSYHDLYITTIGIQRTRLFDLPYGFRVVCTRVSGWELWRFPDRNPHEPELLAGEYDAPDNWLVLDVAGQVIVDSRGRSWDEEIRNGD